MEANPTLKNRRGIHSRRVWKLDALPGLPARVEHPGPAPAGVGAADPAVAALICDVRSAAERLAQAVARQLPALPARFPFD